MTRVLCHLASHANNVRTYVPCIISTRQHVTVYICHISCAEEQIEFIVTWCHDLLIQYHAIKHIMTINLFYVSHFSYYGYDCRIIHSKYLTYRVLTCALTK